MSVSEMGLGIPLRTGVNECVIISQYTIIWFRGGDLNSVRYSKPYLNCRRWGIPRGINSQCHWMHLITISNNIYVFGVGIWTVSEIMWSGGGGAYSLIWTRRGGAYLKGTPRPVSLNVSYHKDKQYIWFRGRLLTVAKILSLLFTEGDEHTSKGPLVRVIGYVLS